MSHSRGTPETAADAFPGRHTQPLDPVTQELYGWVPRPDPPRRSWRSARDAAWTLAGYAWTAAGLALTAVFLRVAMGK